VCAVWNQVLDFGVVILPFLLSLLGVHMSTSLSRKQKAFLVACGLVVSALVWIQQHESRMSHEREIGQQTQSVENLKNLIQTNQITNAGELGYMKARLEDSEKLNERYAPAIMRLAESSAEYTRKQYEAKVLSDKDLYIFTMSIVKKLRDYAKKYEISTLPLSSVTTERQIEIITEMDVEFHASILPDAIYARQELRNRKLTEPTLSPAQRGDVELALRGLSVSAFPVGELADYLEVMAKPLSSK
jgi:hypothetical protein